MMDDGIGALRRREVELLAEDDRLRSALARVATEPLQASRERDRIWDPSPILKVMASTDGTIPP